MAAPGRRHDAWRPQLHALTWPALAGERDRASTRRSAKERVRPDATGRKVVVGQPLPLHVLELLGDAGLVREEEQPAILTVVGQPLGRERRAVRDAAAEQPVALDDLGGAVAGVRLADVGAEGEAEPVGIGQE